MSNILGIDVGYGDVKVAGNGIFTSFPTLITIARNEDYDTGIGDNINTPIDVNGKKYLVGNDAKRATHVFDVRYKTWFLEDEYLALFKKAISLSRPSNVVAVTGLPVSEYKECHDALKKRLISLGNISVNGGSYWIQNIRVMPQPMGAYYNYILNANGGAIEDIKAENITIGVIDIGHRTTDFAFIEGGVYKSDSSGTIDTGVSNLVDEVKKAVNATYNMELSESKCRDAIKTKEIKVFGSTIKIDAIVDKDVEYFTNFIAHKAKTFWKSGAHIDEVLLVGGGAVVFQDSLKGLFPHLKVPKNPNFSNVAGYYKYGNAKQQA